ncbi:MAG: hypothetical protein PHH08_00085 [Candidatus ainarchaeum sp.]|nr:hypothetical protein [Candidatus ainarchaeum sp.]
MGRDEEDEGDRPRRGKKSFWSSSAVLLLFCIILGLIVGVIVEHMYIEPVLAPQTLRELNACKSQISLLNQENRDCLNELHGGKSVANPNDGNNPNS